MNTRLDSAISCIMDHVDFLSYKGSEPGSLHPSYFDGLTKDELDELPGGLYIYCSLQQDQYHLCR